MKVSLLHAHHACAHVHITLSPLGGDRDWFNSSVSWKHANAHVTVICMGSMDQNKTIVIYFKKENRKISYLYLGNVKFLSIYSMVLEHAEI